MSALKMAEGGHETRNVGGHTKLGKDKRYLLEPLKGMQPSHQFDFFLVGPVLDF